MFQTLPEIWGGYKQLRKNGLFFGKPNIAASEMITNWLKAKADIQPKAVRMQVCL